MVFIVLRNMVCTIFVLRHVIFPTHITLDQSLSTNKDKPISSVVAATVNHICFLTRHFIKVNMTGFLTLVFCFILDLSLLIFFYACQQFILLGTKITQPGLFYKVLVLFHHYKKVKSENI